jgi:hypothetical protein
VKTITVRVGPHIAMFSLENETLIHRKLAMTQTRLRRHAAKGYLFQLQNIAVPPAPDPVRAWDIETPLVEFGNDVWDEQAFDIEFPITLPENPVNRETDFQTPGSSGSAQKEAVDPFGSAGRDIRSGWIS